jgi:hypothetical protein
MLRHHRAALALPGSHGVRALHTWAWRGAVRAAVNPREWLPVLRAERRRAEIRMNWSPAANRVQRSDCGYLISAAKCGDAWRFSAWGATDRPELSFWKWLDQQPCKSHYQRGEHVPQRTPLLGVFGSAEAARARCEEDLKADLKGPAGGSAPGRLTQPALDRSASYD